MRKHTVTAALGFLLCSGAFGLSYLPDTTRYVTSVNAALYGFTLEWEGLSGGLNLIEIMFPRAYRGASFEEARLWIDSSGTTFSGALAPENVEGKLCIAFTVDTATLRGVHLSVSYEPTEVRDRAVFRVECGKLRPPPGSLVHHLSQKSAGRDVQRAKPSAGMNITELRSSCTTALQSGRYTDLTGIKVLDLKVLCWYCLRDSRPWYVDGALCWAEVSTDSGRWWALLDMTRNPRLDDSSKFWGTADGGFSDDIAVLYYDRPPGNRDILRDFSRFFEPVVSERAGMVMTAGGGLQELRREILEWRVDRNLWRALIGENPPELPPDKVAAGGDGEDPAP